MIRIASAGIISKSFISEPIQYNELNNDGSFVDHTFTHNLGIAPTVNIAQLQQNPTVPPDWNALPWLTLPDLSYWTDQANVSNSRAFFVHIMTITTTQITIRLHYSAWPPGQPRRMRICSYA